MLVKPFRNWPIRYKLRILFVAMALIAACAVSIPIGVFDVLGLKDSMARDIATLADVLARNSTAALTFHDDETARDVLQALRAEPAITAACTYDEKGKPFAKYIRDSRQFAFTPPAAQAQSVRFEKNRLVEFRKITLRGETLGTIYIESDLQKLSTRYHQYRFAVLVAVGITLILAMLLAPWFQNPIAKPLRHLVEITDKIARAGDYSLRAQLPNRDEFGLLVGAFNGLMEQIETRDRQLRSYREKLEDEVACRTAELSEANQQLKLQAAALSAAANSILITDLAGTVVWSNPAFSALTGYSESEIVGSNPRILNSGQHSMQFWAGMWADITSGRIWHGEVLNRRKDGSLYTEEMTITPVSLLPEKITNFIAIKQDITQRKSAEEKVQSLAYYDTLTGLPNRALLQDRIEQALSAARRQSGQVALLFLDLDRFKIINDSLGHSFGDRLLQEVADRLRAASREQDTVARVGGDEFLIVLTSLEDCEAAATAARRIIAVMSQEFSIQGHCFSVSCSIGISLFPGNGTDVETLIKNADAAMYVAKESGRNTFRFFTEEMNARVVERLNLEHSLRLALDSSELFVVYQPEVDIRSGTIIGAEALLRWHHPQKGLIPPDRFIHVAENSGLILPLGEYVLNRACSEAQRWREQSISIPVAVNVSAVQFRQRDFPEVIRRVLERTGLPPQYLELELTESLLLSNADMAFAVLDELHAMGVRLAVDDFGSGCSSFSYLRQFHVSKLKIDRSFVSDVLSNPDDAAITKAIINLAKSLNITVLAEGVETAAQMSFLERHCCDEIQGFLVSKPISPDEFFPMLQAQSRLPEHQFSVEPVSATAVTQNLPYPSATLGNLALISRLLGKKSFEATCVTMAERAVSSAEEGTTSSGLPSLRQVESS